MQRPVFVMATLLSLACSVSHAGRVVIDVVDVNGKPVADAVVSLSPMPGTPAKNAAPAVRYVDQKDETFLPYVTVLHQGDSVVFRNSDSTRHHVYSFSEVARFEYMLKPGEASPALVLPNPGQVAVGCNIHDNMLTYLYITKDPDIATTDAGGRAVLDGVMPGQYKAHAWHPQLRPGVTLPMAGVTVGDAAPASARFTLALLPDPRGAMDREHIGY
jgi:plastocyanin